MSSTPDRRLTFNRAALDYDAVRPGYPEALIADICKISALPEHGKILEVGCGSGQATLPFAERGFSMLCLDIGSDLLALAAGKCQPYPRVRFLCQAFEDWQPGLERFDLLLSATAFHWIPPAIGYPKAASILNDTGFLALVWNYHPQPYSQFFIEVQGLYRKWVPEWQSPEQGPSLEDDLRLTEAEINQTGLFAPVQVRTYSWAKDYTSADYLRLLNTYSDHHMLEEDRKSGLFGEIKELIDERFAGKITRSYLTASFLAQKKLGQLDSG